MAPWKAVVALLGGVGVVVGGTLYGRQMMASALKAVKEIVGAGGKSLGDSLGGKEALKQGLRYHGVGLGAGLAIGGAGIGVGLGMTGNGLACLGNAVGKLAPSADRASHALDRLVPKNGVEKIAGVRDGGDDAGNSETALPEKLGSGSLDPEGKLEEAVRTPTTRHLMARM